MEFRQFRYILKTAEEGSISAAAQKLYISQPSLSQLIAGVEKKIGAPLFDRSTVPLKPTVIGELYLETARQILSIARDFRQQADDILALRKGHITIGSSPFRSTYALAPFIPRFRQQFPQIDMTLVENTTRNLEQAVLRGDVDFAISLLPVDEKLFAWQELFTEELLLALPPAHPLCAKYHLSEKNTPLPAISLQELQDTPFILIQKEQKLHDTLLALCQKAGFLPQIQLETRSMEAAQAMAGAGLGATLLPDTLIRCHHATPSPCYAALASHPQRRVVIIWRKKGCLSRAARQFIADLQVYYAKSE